MRTRGGGQQPAQQGKWSRTGVRIEKAREQWDEPHTKERRGEGAQLEKFQALCFTVEAILESPVEPPLWATQNKLNHWGAKHGIHCVLRCVRR